MIAKSATYQLIATICIIVIISCGCSNDLWEQDKYQKPKWQDGKIFTQIQKEDDLKTFASLLKVTGYDSILNTSGSYTVFAPTNDAFERFFQDNPVYQNLLTDSLKSSQELISLVEFLLIYNAWSPAQFKELDIYGWIDPEDKFSDPWAFKRLTLYHEVNKSYPAKRVSNYYQIADPSETNKFKIAFTQSNKYCPVFFSDYFSVSNLNFEDFEYYFERSFNPEKLYFAGAEFEENIPAENGFIYKTDKVVLPLLNGEEILMEDGDYSYQSFLGLTNQFSRFYSNLEATYNQPGASEGLAVDTLFNLSYPDLVFNFQNELTGSSSNARYSIREHHGILAPTDEALETFMQEYLSAWGDLEDLPATIKKIIINSHMSSTAVYPTSISQGFLNGEGDRVFLDKSSIIQKTFGSNCTFLGLNKAIAPRAITSVCRPVYLTKKYRTMMYALEATNVVSALKKADANYSFFLPSDQGIGLSGDSSLTVVIDDALLNRYHFESFDKGLDKFSRVSVSDLRKKIFNQIGISIPTGIANKEFIGTLGGNYIVYNNIDGSVSGTAPTTYGAGGDSTITLIPQKYADPTDNGEVYDVDTWFNFAQVDYYGLFVSKHPEFLNLLSKAGLFDTRYYNFPFLVKGEFYTVFVPTKEALAESRADTLSIADLKQFLKYHFVKGELIFTDGNQASGYYTTCRLDESSTTYNTIQSTLNITTKPDMIQIVDNENNVYLEIPEEDGKTNRIVVYDSDENSTSDSDYLTTAVVHTVDKALKYNLLQEK